MKQPDSSMIIITRNPNESPVVQLADSLCAEVWAVEALAEVISEIETSSFRCHAPETRRRAYWSSLKYLISELQTKKPVNVWEANRTLAKTNPCLHSDGFSDACAFLFS